MTIEKFIRNKQQLAFSLGKEESAVIIYLMFVTGYSASDLYIHGIDKIKNETIEKFDEGFNKYLYNNKPIQYLVNSQPFYGYDFFVDERVLIPRFETEELVENVLELYDTYFSGRAVKLCDIGTGSGAIAISLALEEPKISVVATDISNDALDVCKKNAKYHHVNGDFLLGNGLFPSIEQNKKYHMIVANPPYILNRDEVDKSTLNNEPSLALFTTSSLPVYENIISHCQEVLYEHGIIIFEIGYDLVDKLTLIVNKYLPNSKYSFYKDINKKYRIMCIEL